MKKNLISYYRVSSKSQQLNSSLQTQKSDLIKAGVLEENLYYDIKMGTNISLSDLQNALAKINPGDILVVTKMDRISSKMKDFYKVQAELEIKKTTLLCLEEPIEQTTPSGELSFAVLAAASEFELEIRAAIIKSGMKERKKIDFLATGKKALLTEKMKKEYYTLIKNKKLTLAAIGTELKISRKSLVN